MVSFRKLVVWLAGIAVLGIALLILLNSFDEQVVPEAQALLDKKPESIARGENALYSMIGFGVPGNDFEIAAWNLVERINALPPHHVLSEQEETSLTLPRLKLSHEDLIKNLDPGDWNALRVGAAGGQPELLKLVDDNKLYVMRYRSLRRFPRYVYTLQHSYPGLLIPSWYPVSLGKKLWAVDFARQIAAGQTKLAIADLRDDTQLWKRLLSERSITLIGKMFAVSQLRADYRLASGVIRTEPLNDPDRSAMEAAVAPLTSREMSLAGPLEDEFRYGADVVSLAANDPNLNFYWKGYERSPGNIDRVARWLIGRFFLPDATVNELYQQRQRAIAVDAEGCARDGSGAADMEKGLAALSWQWAYNPAGRMFLDLPDDPYVEYSDHLCDLQGLQRLVLLQLKIRQQGIADEHISNYLNAAGPELRDPYSGAPMQWVAPQRALTFPARGHRIREALPLKI